MASVHCSDARMMKAMSHMVPVALGQSHLSPDGSGLLIALHISAVSSFVQVSGSVIGRRQVLICRAAANVLKIEVAACLFYFRVVLEWSRWFARAMDRADTRIGK